MSSWLPVVSLLALSLPHGLCYSQKVLLVSFDGFRWDYIEEGLTPNFLRLARMGLQATYMIPPFSSATFPCHTSMATGLYQETHGIVGNSMYDPVFDAFFNKYNLEERWWNGGEPIWTTAEKQGRRAGTYFWPGTDVPRQGILPTINMPYNSSHPFRARIDAVMSWFTDRDIDLGVLYFDEPDGTGHNYGPNSAEMRQMLGIMDGHLGYLLDKMATMGLEDKVNLIVVSDHGMTEISDNRIYNLYDHVDRSLVKVVADTEAVCNILPVEGKEMEVWSAINRTLTHGQVYYRENMPERWHYSTHRRIHPVLVVMDEGWTCITSENQLWGGKGNHGYDNALMSMQVIFLGHGPDLRSGGFRSGPFESVNVYPLICELLNITPAPNNGSLANVQHLLTDGAHAASVAGAASANSAIWWNTIILAAGAALAKLSL